MTMSPPLFPEGESLVISLGGTPSTFYTTSGLASFGLGPITITNNTSVTISFTIDYGALFSSTVGPGQTKPVSGSYGPFASCTVSWSS